MAVLLVLAGMVTLALEARGESALSVRKVTDKTAEVYLENDQPVAALQFSLSGDGLTLGNMSAGLRVNNQDWQFSFHRVNETTINVVLIRTGMNELAPGQGSIASVEVSASGTGRILLTKVVLASPDAQSIATTVTDLEWSELLAESATLGQNFPNPFNPATTIPYTIERESEVTLTVYDIAGREIRKVDEGQKATGSYTAVWNGTDERGFQVPSGVYLVRLQAGSDVHTKKMILTR
jgi:hypothetical protein